MVTLQEFFNKSGYTTERQAVYSKRLEEFALSYPDKKIYTNNDIAEYSNGSKKLYDEMRVIEKYLRLNFKLIIKSETETKKALKVPVMVEKFLLYLKRKNYAPRTIRAYKEELAVFDRFCKENHIVFIEDVDKNIISAFKDWLYRNKHTKGWHYDVNIQIKILQRTRSFFQYLVKDEYIKINPCIHLTYPQSRYKVSRNLFTRNELDNFFSVIDTANIYGFMDRTIFETLYATGIRTGELIDLRVKDVNLEDGIITVYDGKWRKDRVCFLTIIAGRYLETYIKHIRAKYLVQGIKSDYLFPTRHGKIQETTNLSKRIKHWRNIAGITYPVTIYAFRRSFATHLLQDGVNIRYIQRLMGHNSIKTTIMYINITITDLRNTLIKHHPREKALSNKKIAFRGGK